MKLVWPLLAFALGYLLGWFLFGAPGGVVLTMSLLAALAVALSGGRGGQLDFLRTLLMLVLITVPAGLVLLAVMYVPMVLSPDSPLPPLSFGPAALLLVGVIGLAVLVGCVFLFRLLLQSRARQHSVQRSGGRGSSGAASLLLLAGVFTFAFFPAVRVDCRGLKQDSFMRYGTGFSGFSADQVYWARKPHLIPDRMQLPANFKLTALRASMTRCFQNRTGNRRWFTFGRSAPVIVLHLMEDASGRTFTAAFEPGTHRKLTPWVAAKLTFESTRHPYPWRSWDVYQELREVPVELRPWLRPQPVLTGP